MMKAAKPGEEISAFLICRSSRVAQIGLGCVPPFRPGRHHGLDRYSSAARHGRAGAQTESIRRDGVNGRRIHAAPLRPDPAFGKDRALQRNQATPCTARTLHRANQDGPFYAIKMSNRRFSSPMPHPDR